MCWVIFPPCVRQSNGAGVGFNIGVKVAVRAAVADVAAVPVRASAAVEDTVGSQSTPRAVAVSSGNGVFPGMGGGALPKGEQAVSAPKARCRVLIQIRVV